LFCNRVFTRGVADAGSLGTPRRRAFPYHAVVLLLTIYCALVMLASLSGGWVSATLRISHRRMELALSFIAGAMLGVAFLHLIPHALIARSGFEPGMMNRPLNHSEISMLMLWMLAGFLGMFILERFVSFHVHEPPEVIESEAGEHAHDHSAHGGANHHHPSHSHGHDAPSANGDAGLPHRPAQGYTWRGAFAGLALHSVCCGIAMAAAVAGEAAHLEAAHAGHDHPPDGALRLLGLGTFLIVALHKPFDSLTLLSLMAADNRPMRERHLVNFLYSLTVPLGVLLFIFGLGGDAEREAEIISAALAFSAGMFICISLSDLLPELQFHRHDRVKLTIALLLGLALAWAVGLLEAMGEAGHDHDASPAEMHEHDVPHEHDGESHDGHDHASAAAWSGLSLTSLADVAHGPYHRWAEMNLEHAL
jgi:zinc and cadmium transporter